MLLKRYVSDPRKADDKLILKAAWDTVPNVPVMFFLFRGMAALGFGFIAFFAMAFYCASACQFSSAGS
jgi:cytochrome d ubiquinol oxidase subunit I